MYDAYEDKGKIFTDVITKHPIPVIVQTTKEAIHGKFHVRPSLRIKEELENCDGFVILTDATVFGPDNNIIHKTKMIIIGLPQLVWMLPVDEKENG